MKFKTLGPYYDLLSQSVARLSNGSSPWKEQAAALMPALSKNYKRAEADELLSVINAAQRLHQIAVTGTEHDAALFTALTKINHKGWADFSAPQVDNALYKSLADKLYNAKPGSHDAVELDLQEGSRVLGPLLVNKCLRDKVPFVVTFGDDHFTRTLLNHLTTAQTTALGDDYNFKINGVTKSISSRTGMPDVQPPAATNDNAEILAQMRSPYRRKFSTGELFYTLTRIPTRKDAEIDNIAYDDYIKLFFEMCDQPWDQVSRAQQKLIAEFNTASNVRITNDDGTDVRMSLIDHDGRHFTFCNSLIAKNVPGSEIFSAPRRDSVEGTVVAKGRFYWGGLIENLTMKFEKGKLVRYHADQGQEHFEKAISVDEGALYVGELGIGTNPHLKTHVTNTLLVEKIGGSFHLALGSPYSYTEYGGETVHVNNGGKSQLHWDITTMLHGKKGCIYLDERKVMDNGQWLDPQYDVLNRGWEALPKKDRPLYWKNHFDKPKA